MNPALRTISEHMLSLKLGTLIGWRALPVLHLTLNSSGSWNGGGATPNLKFRVWCDPQGQLTINSLEKTASIDRTLRIASTISLHGEHVN